MLKCFWVKKIPPYNLVKQKKVYVFEDSIDCRKPQGSNNIYLLYIKY